MDIDLKIKKLNSLSDFINGEYQDDIILLFNKKYKDDKWSIICAVMHWFNVVENYIDCKNILKENTADYNWGNVYLYITSVDIITKGINSLSKIINKNNEHLFNGENDIFDDNVYDDNHYFQNIRAVFGAHPTDLNGNGDYIVSTFPTPYNWSYNELRGENNDWDYYTLLWSKNKSDTLDQIEFGFSFKKIDNYLDKYINYLDLFYFKLLKEIEKYKEEISKKKINDIENPLKQLDLLLIEDEKRLNKKYKYLINEVKSLITVNIFDKENKILYEKYRNELVKSIYYIKNAIQFPNKKNEINEVEKLLFSMNNSNETMYNYYYSKLIEYRNNLDLKILLINFFKDKISPFNSNIKNLKELYCLFRASNYYNAYKDK